MAGAAVACSNLPANCRLLSLYNHGITVNTTYSVQVTASDSTSVTFRIPYSLLADGNTVDGSTEQRALFAQGTLSNSNIQQHDSTSKGSAQIDPSSSGTATTSVAGSMTTTSAQPTASPGSIIPEPFTTVAGVNVGWEYEPSTDKLYVTFALSSSSRWNALGYASSGMSGSAVACSNNPASCYLLGLRDYGISSQSPLDIVSSTSDRVTTSVPLSSLTSTQGTQRTLFAQGSFNSGSLSQHSDKATALTDPRTTSVTVPSSNLSSVAWAIVGAVLFLWIVGGILLQSIIKPTYTPHQQLFLASLAILTIALLPLVFAMLNGKHSKDELKVHPYFRGMGHGASLLLLFTIIPVLRHVSIVKYVFRTSFERTAWLYHAAIGVLLFVFVTIHGFGMISNDASQITQTSGEIKPLFGFLAWLCMILMIATAMMRCWFYTTFRSVHWLYVCVFAFAIVHRRKLWMMLLPPLALLFLDYCCRMLTAAFLAGRIVSADHDQASGITWLRIKAKSPKPAKAGDFYCVLIPSMYSGFSHPFSLVSSADDEVQFAVQAVGRWTKSLATAASAGGLVGNTVILMGPYGSVAFSLEKLHTLVIVVGGSGVTPAFAILESLVNKNNGGLAYPHLEEVHVMWTARYPSLLARGAEMMEEHAKRAKTAGLRTIRFSLYCTNMSASLPPKVTQTASSSSTLENLMESLPGRDETMDRRNIAPGTEMEEFSRLSPNAAKPRSSTEPAGTPGVPDNREANEFGKEENKDASPLETIAGQNDTEAKRSEFIEWSKGRPNITEFIKRTSASATEAGRHTGIFACGPDSLMTDLKRVSDELESKNKSLLTFHYESFII
eukprot:GILI01006270.1.p1 GENE.GILI01006270.1~~GILI01006270.1.p1  ORF type:complete len:880 (-),score=147.50 GILI01006270.1:823-3333(-)